MNTEGETREARNRNKTQHRVRRPWPRDVRVALVRAVIDRGLAAYAVAKQLGVPYTTAVQWVQAYRELGEASLEAGKTSQRPNLKKPASAKRRAIVATREAEPGAGSRRIRDLMRRFLGIGVSLFGVKEPGLFGI